MQCNSYCKRTVKIIIIIIIITIIIIIMRTFIHSTNLKRCNNKSAAGCNNNSRRDKTSDAWQKTKQTVLMFSWFSAQQVNYSMWLVRRLRNFGYQWTSNVLGMWGMPAVPDRSCRRPGRVETGRQNSFKYDADTCKPAWRFWIQFVDWLEANADRAIRFDVRSNYHL